MYYDLVHYPIYFKLPNILTIKPKYLSFVTLKVCPSKEWKSIINPKPSSLTNLSVSFSEAKYHRLVQLLRKRISSKFGIVLFVCLIVCLVCGFFFIGLNIGFRLMNLKRILNVRIFSYQ